MNIQNSPSTISLNIDYSNNLEIPIILLLDKPDYKVKLLLVSFSANGSSSNQVSLVSNTSQEYNLTNQKQIASSWIYGTALFNQDIPKEGLYNGVITVSDADSKIYDIIVLISVKKPLLDATSNIGGADGYLTYKQILETLYSTNMRSILPIDECNNQNGKIKYGVVSDCLKFVVVSDGKTGEWLPAGSFFRVMDSKTNQFLKLADSTGNVPCQDWLNFNHCDYEGRVTGWADRRIIPNASNKSVAILRGLPAGKYYLIAYCGQKQVSEPILFTY